MHACICWKHVKSEIRCCFIAYAENEKENENLGTCEKQKSTPKK